MNASIRNSVLILLICLAVTLGPACSKKSSSDPVIPSSGSPRPESELSENLCNWPADDFSPSNHVSAHLGLAIGQYAIDFTLKDTSGTDHKLSTLLATKPVFLIFGSYT
jgi:hypothetical protein